LIMPKREIVLIGLSGNTAEILEAAQDKFDVVAILSDLPEHGPRFEGIPILKLAKASSFEGCSFVCLIGSEKSYRHRAGIIADLGIAHVHFEKVVHTHATVSKRARLGAGTVIYPGSAILANAELSPHVMILANSVVHHDVTIGAYSIVGSNVTVAGHVDIGESCYIGSASSLRNGITVGAGALIGMGANVISDVPPGAVMVGNPARILRQN
jgi:sugar O-acyltransferase (sialic acid O-acetyltransferase NeuD family)